VSGPRSAPAEPDAAENVVQAFEAADPEAVPASLVEPTISQPLQISDALTQAAVASAERAPSPANQSEPEAAQGIAEAVAAAAAASEEKSSDGPAPSSADPSRLEIALDEGQQKLLLEIANRQGLTPARLAAEIVAGWLRYR
jgi:hypothetical protein